MGGLGSGCSKTGCPLVQPWYHFKNYIEKLVKTVYDMTFSHKNWLIWCSSWGWTPQRKGLDPNFLVIWFFRKFSSEILLCHCAVRPVPKMSDFIFPSIICSLNASCLPLPKSGQKVLWLAYYGISWYANPNTVQKVPWWQYIVSSCYVLSKNAKSYPDVCTLKTYRQLELGGSRTERNFCKI